MEISPEQARKQQTKGTVLIDIREPYETALGYPEKALRIPQEYLLQKICDVVPNPGKPVQLICERGQRSLAAARMLRDAGYKNAVSISGGFQAWIAAGLPRVRAKKQLERYARQIRLPQVGAAGQDKLSRARVLIIGAGGLGSPSAMYLAGAGIGTLGLVDHDAVELTNLHRQILHRNDQIGLPKVQSAARTLKAFNPDIRLQCYRQKLGSNNIDEIFDGYDLILDGSDNFPTRYLINDACMRHGLSNVSAAVQGFEGQLSVFTPDGPCYRCLFPDPPDPGDAPNCSEYGVLGMLPGILGTMQALEAVKLITGIGTTLAGSLLIYDGLNQSQRILNVHKDPDCDYCGGERVTHDYIDYEQFCSA